jgi:Zn-dependent protease
LNKWRLPGRHPLLPLQGKVINVNIHNFVRLWNRKIYIEFINGKKMTAMNIIVKIIIWAVPVLFSVVIHEVAHGWMAHRLGDNTAKNMGRLTLNPVSHIDLMGTVILPLIMIIMGGPVFGWAKPVPFNPYNFRRDVDMRTGTMLVGLAGPLSNIILAFISAFFLIAVQKFFTSLPPLLYFSISQLASALLFINLVLAFLNLIPIPPLDGSKILMRFLPPKYEPHFMMLERYGFLIIIILLATGAFSSLIQVPVRFFYGIFIIIPKLLFGLF